MTQKQSRLEDALDGHPPLLDGGYGFGLGNREITKGDVLLKRYEGEYTEGDDISDTRVMFVLRADESGIVFWNAHQNTYGWYDEMFLREDEHLLTHVERDVEY